MNIKSSGTGKFIAGVAIGAFFLSGSAIAVNNYVATNTPEKGYLLCANKKTGAVTFPNKLVCPSGTTALDLGAATGVEGPAGPAGLTGANGLPGLPGLPGLNGVNGANGLTGPQGPAGPQGSEGPAGPQGPVGPAGKDGADGKAGLDGKDGSVTIIPATNYTSDKAINPGDVASLTNPVKLGQVRSLNNFQYVINSVVFPNDTAICIASQGSSTGCKTDSEYRGYVDSASKEFWVTLNISVTNLSNETRSASKDLSFYLVLNSGELVRDSYSWLKEISYMELVKNGKGEATVSFRVPKSDSLSSLIFIIRSPWLDYSTQDNHFALK
jgi:hypothetical protein